jgi:hypothetical protein
MNIKSHQPGWRGLDPCSSADWFDGFRDGTPPAGSSPAPVRPPQTRLAAHDWRRHGLIAVSESPEAGG